MNIPIMHSVALLTLAATLAGSVTTAQAGEPAAASSAESSIRIDIDDLDLSSADVAADVYSRIQMSARLVCRDSASPWDARKTRTFKRCYAATVEAAVVQVNAPQLTALHQAKTRAVLVGATPK